MAKKRKKKPLPEKHVPPRAKYKVGILHSGSDKESDHKKNIQELKKKVKDAGFAPSWDENHHPNDNPAHIGDEAKKLVLNKPDVLVASGGTLAMTALIEARRLYGDLKTPIVFTSVSNPPPAGRYVTGVNARTAEFDPVRLDIVFELLERPQDNPYKIVAIKNPRRPNYEKEVQSVLDEVERLNKAWSSHIELKVVDIPYSSTIDADIAAAFSYFANVRAVVVTADPLYYNRRAAVIKGAKDAKIPTIYQWRQFVEDKGLISAGSIIRECYTLAGTYIGLILKDMEDHAGQVTKTWPIVSPFTEIVVNLTTADQLKITIPPLLLARAETVK